MIFITVCKYIYSNIAMILSPVRYARSIGVDISDDTILLGRTIWGTEPFLIKIGARTRISKHVTFWNHDGGISVVHGLGDKYKSVVKFGRIIIGNNCFIGANVTILPDVRIGDNCVVGAGSVVTKDIQEGEVWGGVPAKYICKTTEYAEKLLSLCPQYDAEMLEHDRRSTIERIADEYHKNKNVK